MIDALRERIDASRDCRDLGAKIGDFGRFHAESGLVVRVARQARAEAPRCVFRELEQRPSGVGDAGADQGAERARKRLGTKKWRKAVADVVERLSAALEVDDVVIGGGNARRLRGLPRNARRVSNSKAFIGGLRLWQMPAGQ